MADKTCSTCAFFGKDAWDKPACTHDEVSTFCDCMGNSVGRPDFGCINYEPGITASISSPEKCCTCCHWSSGYGDEGTCECPAVLDGLHSGCMYPDDDPRFCTDKDFYCSKWEEHKPSPYILPPNAVILCPTALFDKIELKWAEYLELVKVGPYEVVFGATVRIDVTDIPVVGYPGIEAPMLLADHTKVEYTESEAPDMGPTIDSIIVNVEINFGGQNALPMAESMFPMRTDEEAS